MHRPAQHQSTAVLYARVSTKDQEREGFSIPAQLKLLRDYAEVHGLTVARQFAPAESAKKEGRVEFREMVAFLKANPTCRVILVEKTDRLYRNLRDLITIDDLGVEVHLVKENTVIAPDSRSSEKFMHGIKVLMAKNYVDNLSEEVKKGLQAKAELGHWPTVAPIGYLNNRVTHRIEVDRVRGPLVARVFGLYASGDYSLAGLRQKAREIGLRHSRRDRPLSKCELHRMLRQPLYYGEFTWHGTVHQGVHEPLISRATFDQVQAVLHRKPRARYPRQRHAFMGLLTCARCGCAMTAERKKGRYVYYRCTGFHGPCGNTYIREEKLAELLGTTVKGIEIPAAVAEDLVAALDQDHAATDRERRETRQRLEQQRQDIVRTLDRGYDDYVSRKLSEDQWTRRSAEWEGQRQAIDAELARLTVQPTLQARMTAERALELARTAHLLYSEQSRAEQRRLLDTVLSNCTFDRGTLCATYTKPFDLFARGNETGKWRGRRDSNSRPLP